MGERWACRVVNQPRGTQRYRPAQREDEEKLTQAIVDLASQYGRYGYRRITALLKRAGWSLGKDRVERVSTPATKTCRRGPPYLASRRAEGSTKAEAAWAAVAQRWLPKLTFQVIRRTIATLAQKKGTVKDVQGIMRHSRVATTTDVYMQELPEGVRATVDSIHRELQGTMKKLAAQGKMRTPAVAAPVALVN